MNRLVLDNATTLEEGIKLLDANGNGFLPVTDESGKLIGIFTDGDLRKGILQKKISIQEMINRSPLTANISESRISIIKRLHELKRRHMPIVNDFGQFVDVVVLNDFNEHSQSNLVVIMAGGLGTRLGELTRHVPKPMLTVNDKPILQHILERFKSFGFNTFIVCLNYKADVIQDYFGNGSSFNVKIEYTIEKKRLGTAGALSLINRSQVAEQPFIVTNGDIITSVNYLNLINDHVRSKALATMCIKQYSMQLPYANVVIDDFNNMVDLEEKPSVPFFINTGIYAFNPSIFEYVPYNEYLDMPSLFQVIKKEDQTVKVFKMDEDWVDVGLPQDYYSFKNGL